jgi:hypothetical protein
MFGRIQLLPIVGRNQLLYYASQRLGSCELQLNSIISVCFGNAHPSRRCLDVESANSILIDSVLVSDFVRGVSCSVHRKNRRKKILESFSILFRGEAQLQTSDCRKTKTAN